RISQSLTRHELLQLSEGFPSGAFEPRLLGLGNGHARQLAHGGPAQPALLERSRQHWQALQGFSHAQLFVRRARLVAEQSLHVFEETAKSQMNVSNGSLRRQQPTPLLRICCSPLQREARERFVRGQPVDSIPPV